MTVSEIRKSVEWKDLTKLDTKGKFIENSLNYPWLIISFLFAYQELYIIAIPFSVLFFLATLRQVHNGIHNSLGLNKTLTRVSMLLNSVFMSVSTSAIMFNHIRHHKYNLSKKDLEGKPATMKWYEALVFGPVFMVNLHLNTIRYGNRTYRSRLIIESIFIFVVFSMVIYYDIRFLMYHMIVMALGEGLMAFFAVWSVHHDTLDNPEFARTQRGGGWKNLISMGMFYHLEHHIFPTVPTHNLNKLSKRLDKKFPDIEKRNVF